MFVKVCFGFRVLGSGDRLGFGRCYFVCHFISDLPSVSVVIDEPRCKFLGTYFACVVAWEEGYGALTRGIVQYNSAVGGRTIHYAKCKCYCRR